MHTYTHTHSHSRTRALTLTHKDRLYSCSFNKIHIWKGHEDFSLIQEKETNFGAIYSLATTKKYLITGIIIQTLVVGNGRQHFLAY